MQGCNVSTRRLFPSHTLKQVHHLKAQSTKQLKQGGSSWGLVGCPSLFLYPIHPCEMILDIINLEFVVLLSIVSSYSESIKPCWSITYGVHYSIRCLNAKQTKEDSPFGRCILCQGAQFSEQNSVGISATNSLGQVTF